jgi:hypothetical protein
VLDIKKANPQNICAFFSKTTKKHYLTYFDSYLKANSSPSGPKINCLTNIPQAKISSNLSSLTVVDTSSMLRADKRAYFVSIEGYHPLSSYLLFKIERICHALEQTSNVSLYSKFPYF